MNKEKNIKEFDYLTVEIKKEKAEEIIERYECFGWKIEDKRQNMFYENLYTVELCRHHQIANKDELQFLQVNMECDINDRGKLEKNKHAKSFIYSFSVGFVGLVAVIISLLSIFQLMNIKLIWGIIIGVLGAIMLASLPFYLHRSIPKEKANFINKDKILNDSIENCCKQAKKLLGVENEK